LFRKVFGRNRVLSNRSLALLLLQLLLGLFRLLGQQLQPVVLLLLEQLVAPLVRVCLKTVRARVARWFVFKPKIPILVNFGGP
jgi:hypothetical protein